MTKSSNFDRATAGDSLTISECCFWAILEIRLSLSMYETAVLVFLDARGEGGNDCPRANPPPLCPIMCSLACFFV